MNKSKNISQGKNIPQYSFATSNPCPNTCSSVKRLSASSFEAAKALLLKQFKQCKQFVWRCYFTFRNTDFLHLDLLLEELLVIFSDSEVEVNFRKRVPHLFTTSVHPLPVSALISFY